MEPSDQMLAGTVDDGVEEIFVRPQFSHTRVG